MRQRVAESVPFQRMGEPRDVAVLCLYLGSEAAAYVNGAIVEADGGWSLRGAQLG